MLYDNMKENSVEVAELLNIKKRRYFKDGDREDRRKWKQMRV